MKFNISYPLTGAQKCFDVDDDKKYSFFYDRRMGQELALDPLGEQFKGYVAKITGGNDKDGFSMKQGVLVKGRVRLLMGAGHKNYRPKREGERKRKSVRGCIVGSDIGVIALAIVKKGDKDIEGLTTQVISRRLGPKRLTRIKKLFGYTKETDTALIKQNVIRRKFTAPNGKARQKAPKIQRIITGDRLRRKRIYKQEKKACWTKSRKDLEEYLKKLKEWKAAKLKKHQQKEEDKAKAEQQKQQPAEKKAEKKPAEKKAEKKVEKKSEPKKDDKSKQPVEKKSKPAQQPKTDQKKEAQGKPAKK